MARSQVNISFGEVLKNLRRANEEIRNAVKEVLDEGGADIIDSAQSLAPHHKGRLSRSLGYKAEVLKTTGRLILFSGDEKARQYWMTREFGPSGGVIESSGEGRLAFAPPDSPFYGEDTTARQVIDNPEGYGFTEVFSIPGVDAIFGQRGRRSYKKNAKREGGVVLFVLKDSVSQEKYPEGRFLFAAVRVHREEIANRLGAAIAAKLRGDE
jgi:hypothetical protein